MLKNKIKFVTKMMKMFKVLREEHENIIKLKGLCPDERIPRGVLQQGAEGIKDGMGRRKISSGPILEGERGRPDQRDAAGFAEAKYRKTTVIMIYMKQ